MVGSKSGVSSCVSMTGLLWLGVASVETPGTPR